MFFPCVGESSSSKMTSVAATSATRWSKLLQLSLAEVRRRARPVEQLRDFSDDLRAGGVREPRQLFEMFGEMVPVCRALQRRADE